MPNTLNEADALGLLRATLLADASIQGHVANRIYAGWSESSESGKGIKPSIAIVPVGGSPDYSGVIVIMNVDLVVGSAVSLDQAFEIYAACRQLLASQHLAIEGYNHRGRSIEIDAPRGGHNEKTGVWFAAGRWQLSIVRDN